MVADVWSGLGRAFPHRREAKVRVVAFGLAVGRLVFDAEVAATGFVAVECVDTHQLSEVDEVRNATGFLEFLVEVCPGAGDPQVVVELLAQFLNSVDRVGEFVSPPVHPAFVVEQVAELAVEVVGGMGAASVEQVRHAGPHVIHGGGHRRIVDGERLGAQ